MPTSTPGSTPTASSPSTWTDALDGTRPSATRRRRTSPPRHRRPHRDRELQLRLDRALHPPDGPVTSPVPGTFGWARPIVQPGSGSFAHMPAMTWLNQHKFFVLGAGVVFLIVAVAVGFWFFILRDTATPVNLRQALRLYKQDQRAGQTGDASELPPPGVYRYRTIGQRAAELRGHQAALPDGHQHDRDRRRLCHRKMGAVRATHGGHRGMPAPSGAYGITTTLSYEQIAGTQTTDVIHCPSDTYLVPPNAHAGERWHTRLPLDRLNVDWSPVWWSGSRR